ncbi:MAG: hypothetical protein IJX02_09195, partial [Clostridia bacterium]|nr:hypothetical protein [Clostridia bacterium]
MMELNMMNSFLAGAMSKVWEFMSSGIAIAIYAGVLGFVLIMLIIALMGRDSSKASQVVINSTQGTVLQAGGPLVATGGVKAAGKTEAKKEGDGEEEEIQEGKGRFCKLCNLDEMRVALQRASYDEHITLRQFCENFRNYAASRLKLYYDISDIRRFIAGMAVSKILILQGMSGTGKTSLAHAFGDFIDNTS